MDQPRSSPLGNRNAFSALECEPMADMSWPGIAAISCDDDADAGDDPA
jgi:hypothetical protein